MDRLSKKEIKALLEKHEGPCVSIYLPTSLGGLESQQDELRLRHQIRDTENRLLLENLRSTEIGKLLEPLHALLEDGGFWLSTIDGLAIFRTPEMFHCYRLPYSFKEQVVVSDHFYLKPLLPFLATGGHFYILALSQNMIRLLEGTRFDIQELKLPETVPANLAEALKYEEAENEVSFYSSSSGAIVGKGGRKAAIFYGQGVGHDDSKDHLLRYFQQIDRGLHELLRDEHAPLVLAGVEYLLPIYQQANTYPYLLHQGVPGNPDKLSSDALHAKAWEVVAPYFQQVQENTSAQYSDNVGTAQTSNDIREIMPAAYYGQIGSLFVAIDQELWGHFDPASNTIHVHKEARFRDDDLLDEAATQTILHGGSVYAVEQSKIPGETALAAVFRY
ncbi:MAG: baeRF7 domain-containing protein [Ktedonobacteraceae bacterium]